MRPCSSIARDERGVAAVEAALTLPFLLLLGIALAEFGTAFYQTQLVQTGLRDAGRYLSRVPDLAAAEDAARRVAVSGTPVPGETPRVAWWKPEQVQIAYRTTANPRDAGTGQRPYRAGDEVTVVRVSTAVPYVGLGLLTNFGVSGFQIAAAHEERYVGH
ncbi:MAG TPA: TadE/TadG family type IV pilus assembly protein [Beijerinckiaceae bacterium]|nr:TadE/TadG family type IV pilus assembly protein [Beijerinckiaceae bacterium]